MGMCIGAETIKPQPYRENYLQLRNAASGKNRLTRERGPPRPRLSTKEIYVPLRDRGQGIIDKDRL